MPEFFQSIAEFTYGANQRERYKAGDLWSEWADRYPMLFDDQDVEIAKNQAPGGYHFVEWLTAVLLYESFGYHSLVEKYQYTYHPRKYQIFSRIVPRAVIEFIEERTKTDKTQAPDLFVYCPSDSHWFFCEVKGPGDRFRKSQIDYFGDLYRITDKKIGTVRLKEVADAP
jgi:hypothetical protein